MKKLIVIISMFWAVTTAAQTRIIAHRGHWTVEGSAQNSVASFRHAQKIAVYGSECDVQLTKDSVVVVCHDADINKIHIASKTYDELKTQTLSNKEYMPTLATLLAMLYSDTQTKLIIELKPQGSDELDKLLTERTMSEVSRMGVENLVEYISFSITSCREVKRIDPKAIVSFLSYSPQTAITPAQAHGENFDGIDYHFSLFKTNPDWVTQARSMGLITNVWTVNSPEDMNEMVKLGVDFITTDKPCELATIINQK